jgi:single-strand DNA-binding protein
MSEGFNLVTLFGNLGADPELRETGKGFVLKLRLATERSWLNKETNEREKRTEWHQLSVFGPRAESLSKLLHKGARVMVTGRLETHAYEREGQKHSRTEIIVEELFFGGSRPNGAFLNASRQPEPLSGALPF